MESLRPLPTSWYFSTLPVPFRSGSPYLFDRQPRRDGPEARPSLDDVKRRQAELLKKLAETTDQEKRVQLLTSVVNQAEHPILSSYAIYALGFYPRDDVRRFLHQLARKPKNPVLAQVMLDDALERIDPERWKGSPGRYDLLEAWAREPDLSVGATAEAVRAILSGDPDPVTTFLDRAFFGKLRLAPRFRYRLIDHLGMLTELQRTEEDRNRIRDVLVALSQHSDQDVRRKAERILKQTTSAPVSECQSLPD